jgi:hypothetical protein
LGSAPPLSRIGGPRLSPTQHTDELFKSIFGATQTIVSRVGELRNKLGDAHGKGNLHLPIPRPHAELAVNLAGATCCFLIACLESAVAAKKLITSDGRVVLKFDVATVWRLLDHARNAKRAIPNFGERKPRPALWLVGDSGVYLMSNGDPPMSQTGHLIKKKDAVGVSRLTAPAFGCDPAYNAFEDWWPLHNAIDGGNDFSMTVPIEEFEDILPLCKSQVVFLIKGEQYQILSDGDFQKGA